jgi:hypothetical protein
MMTCQLILTLLIFLAIAANGKYFLIETANEAPPTVAPRNLQLSINNNDDLFVNGLQKSGFDYAEPLYPCSSVDKWDGPPQ